MPATQDNLPSEAERTAVERTSGRPVFTPYVDIYEDSDGLTLVADMPGVPPDGVDVRVEKATLLLRGHAPALKLEGGRAVFAEYQTGDYERSFTISSAVDTAKIDAQMANGVLTLRLPKAQSAKERKIQVKSG